MPERRVKPPQRGEQLHAHGQEVAETLLVSIPRFAYWQHLRCSPAMASDRRGGVILLNIIISGGRYPGWFNVLSLILIIAILSLFTLLVVSYPATQAGITIGLGITSLMFLSLGVLGRLLETAMTRTRSGGHDMDPDTE